MPTSYVNILRSLTTDELSILHAVYRIKDFLAIRTSDLVFKDKSEEGMRFVWRSLFKFEKLGLLELEKHGSFIRGMYFNDHVESSLSDFEFVLEDPFATLDMSMLLNEEDSIGEFMTLFTPEDTIKLKGGVKYRVRARFSEDQKIELRISTAV